MEGRAGASTLVTASTARPPRELPAPERWLRVAAYFVLFLLVNVYYELALRTWAIGFSLFDPAGRKRRFNTLIRQWGCVLFWLTVRLLKGRLEVVGRTPPGRFIVVANHQSTADIAILFAVFESLNCKFVAKQELGRFIPSVSLALTHGGFGLVSRNSSRADLRRLRDMGRGLEAWDGSAVLFAEGTRSRDGRVLPYKAAAIRVVAEASRLPLLPVAIDGTWVASDLPGFARHMPCARVRLVIGEPIPVERWEDGLDETIEIVRRWTVATVDQGRLGGAVPRPPGWEPGLTDSAGASAPGAEPCIP